MFYSDKIEKIVSNYGVEHILKKSYKKRDLLLVNMPHDELLILFQFMDSNDIILLFSSDVIKNCFKHIPIQDTFPLLSECDLHYYQFLSNNDIKNRILCMPFKLFYEEMENHYNTLLLLIKENVITRQDIKNKLHYVTLSELSNACRIYPIWKKWIHPHPLLEQLPFPSDVSIYIFNFL